MPILLCAEIKKYSEGLYIVMTFLSIILMGGAYLFPADIVHEIIGATLFVLWAVHITLNRKWYSSDTRMQNHTSTRLHLRLTCLYHSRSMAVFNLATTILFPQP